QAEDGIRDPLVTGVQTCALPISVVSLSGFRQGKWGKIPILFGLALHQLNDHRKQTIAGLNSYSGTSNIANHNIDTGSRAEDSQRSEERRVGKERRAQRTRENVYR